VTAKTEKYQVRGLQLAYHTWGERTNPAILLLHGFQDHGESYARLARELAGSYYLIAPDHRGHGKSDWVGDGGDYYFYDYVNDILRLLDVLQLPKLSIAGHSMGGNIASFSSALLKERVSSLVLLEGMGFEAHDLADTVNRLIRWSATLRREEIDKDKNSRRLARQRMKDLDEAAERLIRYNGRLDRQHAKELAATFAEPAPDNHGVMWRFDPLHKTPSAKPYVLEEAMAIWRALDMPVLSLYGSESPWFPADLPKRLACIKNVRSVIVDGAGHNIHHDRPEILARMIDQHLRAPGSDLPDGVRFGLPGA
jgi:pimeloyl-ACP methyl ester carboxylesterase